MKNLLFIPLTLFLHVLWAQGNQKHPPQAPILVEAMGGHHASMFQMVISRHLQPGSAFGFFNLINYEISYDGQQPNPYIIQSIFTYEWIKGLQIGAGANLKAFGGFKPLVAMSYGYFNPQIGFLIQPSYELGEGGAFEVFSMFEWHPINAKKIQPYFRVQALTSWTDGHGFSYHNWRLGLQYRQFRLGPGLNVQYFGKEGIQQSNLGGFINIMIP